MHEMCCDFAAVVIMQSVSGRVLLSELNKVGSTRRNVAVEGSDYVSKVGVES